jgi:3'-5' exoribonuclease
MNDTSAVFPICVKNLKTGDTILQYFKLRSKEGRKTRSGQDYLDVVLSDATGAISGKIWSDVIKKWGQNFTAGDYVKVEGRVESYRDKNQLVIEKIRKVDLEEIPDPDALEKKSDQEPSTLMEELRQIAGTLEPVELSQLVQELLDRHADPLMEMPAAQMVHHAYKGGLIEHVVAVTRKVMAILPLEKEINRNIAIAGAILHDMGKVRELNAGGAGRTPEGRLIGHVILGLNLLREAASDMGLLDKPWLTELEHILLSHHGETQFGAPVKPFTREALLVHFIDNLDAKLKIMAEALEAAEADGFAPYNKWLEGKAFLGNAGFPQEENNVGS